MQVYISIYRDQSLYIVYAVRSITFHIGSNIGLCLGAITVIQLHFWINSQLIQIEYCCTCDGNKVSPLNSTVDVVPALFLDQLIQIECCCTYGGNKVSPLNSSVDVVPVVPCLLYLHLQSTLWSSSTLPLVFQIFSLR